MPADRPPYAPRTPDPQLESEWAWVLDQTDETAARPPSVVATPASVRPGGPDAEIRWWRPGWVDAWRHVGWRWVFLLPALGLLLLAVPALRWPSLWNVFIILELKLLIFVTAIALTLAGYVVRRAARARREPFCIFCGYNLTGLPDHYRCPECGRPYTWRLIAEYRRDPQWFIERYAAARRLPPADVPFDAGAVRRPSRDGT